MMIKFAEDKHREDIARVWEEAFGDAKEDVYAYLNTVLDYVLIFEEESRVCGILTLLPARIGKKQGRYVYAVATLKKHRGRGISTALLDYAKEYIRRQGEEFLVLVPQNDELFEFYKKRGFKTVCNIIRKAVLTGHDVKKEFSVEKLSADQYYEFRNKSLKSTDFVEWGRDMLQFAKDMYNGEFYVIKEKYAEVGVVFCFVHDNTLHIKELLGDENCIVSALSAEFGVTLIKYNITGKEGTPYAMMYPMLSDSVYFELALD